MSYGRTKATTEPQRAEKLTDELQKCEQLQDTMKAVNAHWRKTGTCMGAPGITDAQAAKLDNKIQTTTYSWERQPFSSYDLTNNNSQIKRLREKLAEVSRGFEGWEFDGGRAEANTEMNRLQLFFDQRPSESQRAQLKANGYRYYRCVMKRSNPNCTTETIKEADILNTVFQAIKKEISTAADVQKLLDKLAKSNRHMETMTRLQDAIKSANMGIKRNLALKDRLFDAYGDDLITEQEYRQMKDEYTDEAERLTAEVSRLEDEYQNRQAVYSKNNERIISFLKFKKSKVLTRERKTTSTSPRRRMWCWASTPMAGRISWASGLVSTRAPSSGPGC